MADTEARVETGRFTTCRNLVREVSADSGESGPGRYCENRLGVVHYLDCPVYQGLECCLFDPRPEDEPAPAGIPDVEDLRARLAEDYLRWSYWRRVGQLRAAEPPADERRRVAAQEEEEEHEELAELVRHQTKPVEADRPVEKYPGQHRSEDRRKKKEASDAPEPPPPLDEILEKELFEEPAKPPAEDAPEPAAPATDETPPKSGSDEKPAQRRPRRRGRRRGRRGRGRKPKPPGDKPASG